MRVRVVKSGEEESHSKRYPLMLEITSIGAGCKVMRMDMKGKLEYPLPFG